LAGCIVRASQQAVRRTVSVSKAHGIAHRAVHSAVKNIKQHTQAALVTGTQFNRQDFH
jgi:hypothetical protein